MKNSLIAAAVLAILNRYGLSIAPSMGTKSTCIRNANHPKMVTASPEEIAAWNREVDRKKAEKRERKFALQLAIEM